MERLIVTMLSFSSMELSFGPQLLLFFGFALMVPFCPQLCWKKQSCNTEYTRPKSLVRGLSVCVCVVEGGGGGGVGVQPDKCAFGSLSRFTLIPVYYLDSFSASSTAERMPSFFSSSTRSPFWCICRRMSQPPTNSPLKYT